MKSMNIFRILIFPMISLVLLSSCSRFSAEGPKEPDKSSPPSGKVTLTLSGVEKESKTLKILCDDTSNPRENNWFLCYALATGENLQPVTKDAVCTMIYGGPGRITVKGVVKGKKINLLFTQENGCEIERWEYLQGVLQEYGYDDFIEETSPLNAPPTSSPPDPAKIDQKPPFVKPQATS
jgi:hypothetical protein